MLMFRERLHVGMLAVGMTVNGTLQSFSLAALLPVIGLMLDPGAATSGKGYLATLSRILGHPEPGRLLTLCLFGVLAAIVLKNVFDLAYNHSLNRLVAAVEKRVAVELLRDCMAAPYAWFLSNKQSRAANLGSQNDPENGRAIGFRRLPRNKKRLGRTATSR